MSNSLIGCLPKVGIRPAIDGCERGMLESMEVHIISQPIYKQPG